MTESMSSISIIHIVPYFKIKSPFYLTVKEKKNKLRAKEMREATEEKLFNLFTTTYAKEMFRNFWKENLITSSEVPPVFKGMDSL